MKNTDWERDIKADDTFYKINKFNNTYYKISFTIYYFNKSIKVYIGATSGLKRKHLEDYEVNDYPRDGGIKALLWIKEEIKNLPSFLSEYYILSDRDMYICINWVDAKRRNVYSRLIKEGFRFMVDSGEKTLMKKINYGSKLSKKRTI